MFVCKAPVTLSKVFNSQTWQESLPVLFKQMTECSNSWIGMLNNAGGQHGQTDYCEWTNSYCASSLYTSYKQNNFWLVQWQETDSEHCFLSTPLFPPHGQVHGDKSAKMCGYEGSSLPLILVFDRKELSRGHDVIHLAPEKVLPASLAQVVRKVKMRKLLLIPYKSVFIKWCSIKFRIALFSFPLSQVMGVSKIFIYENICHINNLVKVIEYRTSLGSSAVQLSLFTLLTVTVVCSGLEACLTLAIITRIWMLEIKLFGTWKLGNWGMRTLP